MKNFKIYLLITIFFTFLLLGLFIVMDTFVEPWTTNKYTDVLNKFSKIEKASNDVVIIMIDQKSINRIRWPWPRKFYANIIEYLEEYGHASVIAQDGLITSPDTYTAEYDKYFYNTIKKYDNYIAAFDVSVNPAPGTVFSEEEMKILDKKNTLKVRYETDKVYPGARGILKLQPEIVQNASILASVTTPLDNIGYIRASLPIIRVNNKDYPGFPLAAIMKHKNINSFVVYDNYLCSDDDCKTLKIKGENSGLGFLMYLKWYKPLDEFTTHKTYSAIDIIDSYELIKQGKKPIIDPKEFEGKIVIIGAAAAKVKSLEDLKSTPIIQTNHAGADIQATAISNLLTNSYRYEHQSGKKFIIAFNLVIISILVLALFKITGALITLGALMLGYFITAIVLFYHGTTIHLITPIALMLLVISAGFTIRFLIEGKKKEQIQNAMGMYISKDIMKNVVKNIDNLKLGGKRANISVLFADIRGFTSISERLTAEEVTSILNEYFSAVEPIIRKHNGVLNKFIGDAVLAIFGEPIQDKNHAKNAVLCANEMHKKMESLQHKWDLEGKPHIEIGIAINTGDAFVGNIGSPERIEYTVIGDTVNTASRIESYNKVYKTKFLISESTYEKISRICDVIKIREVSIRGKSKKINIYEVLRITDDTITNDNR